MAGDLRSLSVTLNGLLSDLEPVQLAVGLAAKDAAHEAIERAVGGDRRMSGIRSKRAKLGAGFDLGNPIVLNLRPKGLIILADGGRKNRSVIYPRSRRRRRGRPAALMTPMATAGRVDLDTVEGQRDHRPAAP